METNGAVHVVDNRLNARTIQRVAAWLLWISIFTATSACLDQGETQIVVRASYPDEWGLTSMAIKANNTLRTTKAQREFTLVLPEDWASGNMAIEFFGLVDTDKKAYAKADVVVVRGQSVEVSITLQTLACVAVCSEGETRCEADGVATCVLVQGCPAWSAAVACDAATPFCSNGVCAATCSDECSVGAKRCDDASGAQVCGQFDADNCLEWKAPVACTEEQACKNNVCTNIPAVATFQKRISGNYRHTCAIRNNGTVACWGNNSDGQATPPAGSFVAVTTTLVSSCGLRADGRVDCWGKPGPLVVIQGSRFSSIEGSSTFVCGMQIGSSQPQCWGYEPPQAPGLNASALSGGSDFHCALKTDQRVQCWGTDNESGVLTPPTGTFTAIDAGYFQACGLRSDRTAVCWGDPSSETPTSKFVAMSSGGVDNCGIRYRGELECWSNTPGAEATAYPSGAFAAVASGAFHACGIRANGTIACWGDNEFGQLNAPAGNFLP